MGTPLLHEVHHQGSVAVFPYAKSINSAKHLLCAALQVAEKPATAGVVCTLVVTWLLLQSRRLGYAEVGLSYNRAVIHGEVGAFSIPVSL